MVCEEIQAIQPCLQCGLEIREKKEWICSGCRTRLCWLCWDAGDGKCRRCRLRAKMPASAIVPVKSTPYVEVCIECQTEITGIAEVLCWWCMQPLCHRCFDVLKGNCSLCARKIAGLQSAAALRVPRRRGVGRPKKLRECGRCHQGFGAREFRGHECLIPCSVCKLGLAEHPNSLCDGCFLRENG